MIIGCNQKLLADTEMGEDVAEGVLAGDLTTCDFADRADGVP